VYTFLNGALKKEVSIEGDFTYYDNLILGKKWLIFSGTNTWSFDFETHVLTLAEEALQIKRAKVIKDNKGESWVYGNSGVLIWIDSQSGKVTPFLLMPEEKRNYVDRERYYVVHDSRGIIWIGTYGNGLFVYDVANGQMKHIVADSDNAQSQIGSDFLQCVIEDHSGNIWVSSEYTGVSRLEVLNEGTLRIFPAGEGKFNRSKVQDDLQRLKRICRKNVRAIAFFIFPIMLLMVVVSYPLISIMLKEQWVPSVPYFRLLCFSGICSPFIILFFDLFNSLGYSRLNLQLEIGKKIYLFAGIALFYSSGILWLIGWWISYSVLSLAASIFFARRFLGYGFGEYVKDIFPYFILALASAILSCGVYLLLPSDLWRLCLVPVVYVVLYLGGAYMLKLEMLQEMLSMLKSRVKRGGEA
jgi:hypothetical protein